MAGDRPSPPPATAMSNGRISIDWKSVFRRGSPPREVDVVASSPAPQTPAPDPDSSGGEEDGGAAEFEGRPDHVLRDKIRRMRAMPPGARDKLPDGGAKWRRSIRRMEKELGRRSAAGESRKDSEASKRTSHLNTKHDPFSFDVSDELDSNSISRNLLPKLSSVPSVRKSCNQGEGAFSNELSLLGRNRCTSLKKDSQIRSSRSASVDRNYSSKFSSRTSASYLQRFRDVVQKGAATSRLHIGDGIERKKASKHQDSSYIEFEKVRDVVLLDDEDEQPVEPVDGEMADKRGELKIYYPSRNDPWAVELTYSDIKCLEPGVYLSSPVINFYIQYLKRSKLPGQGPDGHFHIFNTYFYSKLEEAVSSKGDRCSRFLKLRRWWKGVDIFRKAYIVLPIHGKMHWSLIIICMPGKDARTGPIILHLDSLGLHSSGELFDTVKSYLEAEWRHVCMDGPRDFPFSDRVWNSLPSKQVVVPQQKNEYDCGIFMLYYIERFIREAPESLTSEQFPTDMFGRKWFNPEDASGLRERIRLLLSEEFESCCLEGGVSASAQSDGGSECDEDADGDVVMPIVLESSDE